MAQVRRAALGDPGPVDSALRQRMAALSEQQRFEQAATWRNRLEAARHGIESATQLRAFGQIPELVAARSRSGGWDIHVIRHGRMAAAAFCPANADARAVVETVVLGAEQVLPPPPPTTSALIAESRMLMRWLESARLVRIEGSWTLPLPGLRPATPG